MKAIDLTGQRFGRLLVLQRVDDGIERCQVAWICVCDCGKQTIVLRGNLRNNTTKSCGCLAKELSTIHGKSNTRAFSIWTDMKRRCNNKNTINFPSYGGQGISYVTEWEHFENFWADMEETYSDNLTLERIDPRKGYSKENCKWIPRKDQSKNKKLYKNNKTGVDGTYVMILKGIETLVAHFSITSNQRTRKTFSLRKYTLEEALILAKIWRENLKVIHKYGEFHGSTIPN